MTRLERAFYIAIWTFVALSVPVFAYAAFLGLISNDILSWVLGPGLPGWP